jgi:CMP-N-acetylneuraminic acid synthetase
MSVVAVIPARGGSKGIPRKNLEPLAGKPLIAWTIEAALEARTLDRVLVSTDDAAIAAAAERHGAEVPFLRPAPLGEDGVHAIHVMLHAVDWLERTGELPEAVVMLLPTSPLRSSADIDAAVKTFRAGDGAPVVAVYASDKTAISLRWVVEGRLTPILPLPDPNVQRQDAQQLYAVNGAIYVAEPARLRREGTFHAPDAIGLEMPRLRSIDVNTREDLLLAEFLLDRLSAQQPKGAVAP